MNNNCAMFTALPEQANRQNNKIKDDDFRDKFDRDRDRILYSKAFRRLSGKTQVFFVGSDDHIRTRLTHTLEVAQIARITAKNVGVNETLTEAIALGHDIGHTPFGHVGERTLNYIMNGCYTIKNFNTNLLENKDKGFKHNWQGVRVVNDLERIEEHDRGLNLTNYTIWGILHHSNDQYSKEKGCLRNYKNYEDEDMCNLSLCGEKCKCNTELSVEFYEKYRNNNRIDEKIDWSIEGLIVEKADEIAQRHHDIEDGIEAKIIDKDELVYKMKECFGTSLDKDLILAIEKEKNKDYYLPMLSKLIVSLLNGQLIKCIIENLKALKDKYKIVTEQDFYNCKSQIFDKGDYKKIVCYSKKFEKENEEFEKADKKFKDYLKNRILNSYKAQSMDGKGDYIIRQLFKAYLTNPQQLPDKTILALYKSMVNKEIVPEKLLNEENHEVLIGDLRNELNKNHFNKIFKCVKEENEQSKGDKNEINKNKYDEYKRCLLRTICDYISGMTDNYAMDQYRILYGSGNF